MATSNDTRVRVDGLSNTIASVFPVRGVGVFMLRSRALFIARLLSISAPRIGLGMSIRSRKCLTPLVVMRPPWRDAHESAQAVYRRDRCSRQPLQFLFRR